MTASELRDRIKALAKQVYKEKSKSDDAALAYDELVKFPELKHVIVSLLTPDFDKFEVGGCCVTGSDPLHKCMSCESSW